MNELQELKKQLQEQQDKITYLQAEIERLEKIEQGNQWIPSLSEVYWLVDDGGRVLCSTWDNHPIDKDRLSVGNVYPNGEKAEFEAERLKVINELKKYSREFVNGEDNYQIVFNYERNKITHFFYNYIKASDLYFPSEEAVRKAVKAVGKERVIKYYLGVNNHEQQ